MHPSRAPSNWPGPFFAAQFSAGCTINISGFDLRQAQSMDVDGSDRGHPAINKIRNSDLALRAFLSCALWIIKREGIEEGRYPGSSATLPGNIVLRLACIGAHHFALSIRADVKGAPEKSLFRERDEHANGTSFA
jgi:hypothetical protein